MSRGPRRRTFATFVLACSVELAATAVGAAAPVTVTLVRWPYT